MPGPMSSHLFDSFTQSSRPPFVEHMSITSLHGGENWGPEKSVTHSKPHSEWWSRNLSPDGPAWQPLYHSGSPILDNLYLGGMMAGWYDEGTGGCSVCSPNFLRSQDREWTKLFPGTELRAATCSQYWGAVCLLWTVSHKVWQDWEIVISLFHARLSRLCCPDVFH